MEIESLLKHILPKELLDYFELIEVRESQENVLFLYLDEKSVIPPEYSEKQIVSQGFDEPVTIQDFPLREKSVYLVVRRRKWKDKQSGKIYSRTWDLTAKGTSYSKEFAAFLKGLFGQLPHQQQKP
jgi:transposase